MSAPASRKLPGYAEKGMYCRSLRCRNRLDNGDLDVCGVVEDASCNDDEGEDEDTNSGHEGATALKLKQIYSRI